jgi:hypothetical protein
MVKTLWIILIIQTLIVFTVILFHPARFKIITTAGSDYRPGGVYKLDSLTGKTWKYIEGHFVEVKTE